MTIRDNGDYVRILVFLYVIPLEGVYERYSTRLPGRGASTTACLQSPKIGYGDLMMPLGNYIYQGDSSFIVATVPAI